MDSGNGARPTVTSFVGTFLKGEMWHVYNQIAGLRRFRSLVLTRERRNEAMFPHPGVHEVQEFPLSWIERGRLKYLKRAPQIVYRGIIPSLVRQLDGLQTGLLHIYFGHEATRLAPLFDYWKKPVVVSFHGADLGTYVRRPSDLPWLPSVWEHSRAILARCEFFRPHLIELGCPPSKIRLNRTNISHEFFTFVQRPPPPGGAWNLMQACRLIPKKGLLTTLEAFALFREKHPAATLTIAGEGPQLGDLQRRVRQLNLTRCVYFVGFLGREELRRAYHDAHFFLHPSATDDANDIEGIPNSLLEAMCTGLPCLSTPHSGIPEAVTHGTDGFLLPERDAPALAETMFALAGDPARYGAVAAAAAARIRTEYSPERQIGILEDIYAAALDG
jgi:colanic acid/amylovoran biosynthesis glycosyltransferase